jgi:hypothetical protein
MGMTFNRSWVESLRSLGFGGLLGSGVLGVLFFALPGHFGTGITLAQALEVGGLLGAGFHRALEAVVVDTVARPAARFVGHYLAIGQIVTQSRMGLMSGDEAAKLIRSLNRQYFLPPARSRKALGPGA